MKGGVIKAANSLSKFMKVGMCLSENAIAITNFDAGFATKNALRKAPKLSELIMLKFKRDCLSFVRKRATKIGERSQSSS